MMKSPLSRMLVIVAAVAMGAALLPAQDTQVPAPVRVTALETTPTADGKVEVKIAVSGRFTMETFDLGAPRRLVLDITPAEAVDAPSAVEVNAAGVLRVRASMFQPGVARIVFDLAESGPAHSISQTDQGLKLVFWLEAAPVAVTPAAGQVEAAPAAAPTAAPVTAASQAPSAPVAPAEPSRFFVAVGGAIGMLPQKTTLARDIPVFGETGKINETYKGKGVAPSADLEFGRFFNGGIRIKAGIAASYSMMPHSLSLSVTLPHPFVPNTPRSTSFSANYTKDKLYVFQVFGLFGIVSTDKLSVWLGPTAGFATGKFSVLSDFEVVDEPPFTTISLTNVTPLEESVSGPTFGGRADVQYVLSPKLSIQGSLRGVYFNPKSSALGVRLNLLQAQFGIGLIYAF